MGKTRRPQAFQSGRDSRLARPRIFLLCVSVSAALCSHAVIYAVSSASQKITAKNDAIDYVRINGYGVSEHFVPGELHSVLQMIMGPRCEYFLGSRIPVGMLPSKFNDNMIEHLMAIDNLSGVYLYDRNDTAAKPGTKMVMCPIRDMATYASLKSVETFHKRFPQVNVVILDKTRVK